MSIRAEYDVPLQHVWDLWKDPRKLERWWGPPTWPATFVKHDLSPGGDVSYYMTGPEGNREYGWWRVLSVDEPRSLEFENGLADTTGTPVSGKPFMVIRVVLGEEPASHTVMDLVATFPSVSAMEMYLTMGMAEGMAGAMSQIDDLL